ncbi:hypothetical protein K1F50_19190 [Muricauda oceani]|uniref:Uncharacterized protein n=1 Tax=Flagellimonas oceani TaxID=2698672 RepID=A0A6G7IYE6_9FLAO|nr:hypothetical protein [Allomuricauda oceani]MBW8244940.1 hypothetical protein [Allomuricauda oceani]QII43358.1 hypothetical protein GVT53_01180 [Allomuricauda oceani]
MNTPESEDYKKHIAHCFLLVSKKLSRGPIALWGTRDFQVLSESIQEETGILLSISTLKRLSGRVRYKSRPNSSTLDTLAKYIGYDDWRVFSNSLEPDKSMVVKEKKRIGTTTFFIYTTATIFLILVVSSYLLLQNRAKYYSPNDFAFSIKSVTTGLPNSVVFKYNASIADEKDKIEIQQDWDKRKRVAVNKNDSILTSIYYRPGFFKSKLVVNDSIVKEKDVFIPSNGWLATIETDSIPVYLNLENELSIDLDMLKVHGIDPRTSKTIVGLYQVRDFGELYTDEFELTTSFQNNFQSGNTPCQVAQLTIIHEDGPIVIPVCNKGCISEISLFAFDKQISGKKNDLSNFGVEPTDLVQLKCLSKDQKMIIAINGNHAYTFDVTEKRSKILGIGFFFEGTGLVKNVRIKKNNKILYDSNN